MLETVTGRPQSLLRCLARMRAFRSVTPPGGNGTTNLISLFGKLCAAAGTQPSTAPTMAPKPISSAPGKGLETLIETSLVHAAMAAPEPLHVTTRHIFRP